MKPMEKSMNIDEQHVNIDKRHGTSMNTLELGCSEFHFQILVNGCLVTKIKSLALAASPQEL